MKELVMIDGNSLLYRAYYATAAMGNLMVNKDGVPTNAVYGFANMLESILKGNPEYLVVAFDYGKKTFRNDLFEVYKGTRSATPDELACQFSMIREYLTAHGIRYQEIEGYEGDDIIGTVAVKASKQRFKVSIVTSDKDASVSVATAMATTFKTKMAAAEAQAKNDQLKNTPRPDGGDGSNGETKPKDVQLAEQLAQTANTQGGFTAYLKGE